MKTVLAPIDFSDLTRGVIAEAVAIARATDARLVLLHIVQIPALAGTGIGENDLPSEFHLEAENDAIARLSHLQKKLRDEGVTAHVIHRIGSPAERILEQCDRLEADYLVMGSRGHGALHNLMVGSTTTRVLENARCPVTIVPPTLKPRRDPLPLVAKPRDGARRPSTMIK
jgi:nucleotide-binding universal stress UspA family protein